MARRMRSAPRLHSLFTLAGGAVLCALVALACSSSSPGGAAAGDGCNADPSRCAAGKTCWPIDTTPAFACIGSAPAATFGAACDLSVGTATCGDRMACDLLAGAARGVCTYYCSDKPGFGCPAGFSCRTTYVGNATAADSGATGAAIHICRAGSTDDGGSGNPPPSDGGIPHYDAAPDAAPNQM